MIKAIQTEYNNLLFRSRLEARWAYIFDLLQLPYEYEREGFELPSGNYLPDFWMPTLQKWVEIKGSHPTHLEEKLAYQLADNTRCPVIIFWGNIEVEPEPGGSGFCYLPGTFLDAGYCLCECPNCGFVGIEFDGRSDRLPCKQTGCETYARNGDKTYTGTEDRIVTAYQLGRKARFEYGETPMAHRLQFIPYPLEKTTKDYELEEAKNTPSRHLPDSVDYDKIAF